MDYVRIVLQPGEMACLHASVRLDWEQSELYLVLECDPRRQNIRLEASSEVVSMMVLCQDRRWILATFL